jgi:hypothetical protein
MNKPRLKECKRGHDLTLPNSRYFIGGTSRCRECVKARVLVAQRKKRGTDPDLPVRVYVRRNQRRSRPILDLIQLVNNDRELAEYLLSVAKYARIAQELDQETRQQLDQGVA